MKNLYQLYIITNNINNKKYVGQTNQDKGYLARFKEHCECALNGEHNYLYCAMRKYGINNFSIKLLLKNIEESKIDFYEQLYIKKFNTFYQNNFGYNMTLGGQGTHGYVFSDDVKQRLSIKSKQVWERIWADEEKYKSILAKRSKSLKGKKFTKSHRDAISAAAKLKVGNKNPFYGKRHTDAVKNTISEKNGKPVAMYDKNNNLIKTFKSLYEAAQYLINNNYTKSLSSHAAISHACSGKVKTSYGFIWKYL